jgi:hypothetical protein
MIHLNAIKRGRAGRSHQPQSKLEAACHSVENGFPVAVAACNEAGKPSLVIATYVLWFLWNLVEGRCVITSGSWTQLESQLLSGLREFSGRLLVQFQEFSI